MIALGLIPVLGLIMVITGCTPEPARDSPDRVHPTGPEANISQLTDAVSTPRLDWQRCPALPGGPNPSMPGLRCAGLSVPRDYAHPGAGSIRIAVSRLTRAQNASDPQSSRPVVISNPGGPGASGLFNTLGVDGAFGGALAAQADLVSFDPRGVNRSAPVDCGLAPNDAARASGGQAPTTFGADAAFAERVANSCAAHRDVSDPFVTTNNTVRDVELLRRALGRDRISWVGTSYGSELATGYATVFPDRTDRVVLDSPSDMTRPWWQVLPDTAPAAEARFDQVAQVIADRDADWHLGATPAAVRASYLRVIADLDDRAVVLDGQRVSAAVLQSARLTPALLDDSAIEPLAQTLRYLLRVPGAPSAAELLAALDRADRAAGSTGDVNGQSLAQQIAAYLTVRCNDSAWPTDPEHYRRAGQQEARRHPVTRGQFSMINACAYWPSTTREPMIVASDAGWSGPANVLLLSATGDYRAFPAGVANTRRALGRRAVSVTTEDYHHVVVGRNTCATGLALDWLLNDHPQTRDRRCPS